MVPFSIIVAIDEENGIGRHGQLSWHIPGELKHFRDLTIGGGHNAVIMGEVTWLSLPEKSRPLPHRDNIVLSQKKSSYAGAKIAGSFDEAFSLAIEAENVFIIGGASVYKQAIALPNCKKLYITRVQGGHHCDVYFPPIPDTFKLIAKVEPITEGHETYWFEEFTRA
jgi:dihydrofolate reductase